MYSRQNTSSDSAASGVSELASVAGPKSTDSVETTVSLAMKPAMSAVTMRQSPSPSGANSGAIHPATIASRLFSGSSTIVRLVPKDCKNHTTIVAMKMTVNARTRKSLVLSHTRCPTLFALGMR